MLMQNIMFASLTKSLHTVFSNYLLCTLIELQVKYIN